MKRMPKILCLLLIMILLFSAFSSSFAASAANYNWAGSWGSPAVEGNVLLGNDSVFEQNGIRIRDYIPVNSTIRTVIQPTIGGTKIRLKFSNIFGTESITINETTIAKTGKTDDIVIPETITQVTFNGGMKAVTIAPGNEVYSDEIDFNTTALEKLSISSYFRNTTPIYTAALYGGTTYLASSLGNRTQKETMTTVATRIEFSSNSITYHMIPYLTRLDVYAENAYCVVLLGDSTVTNDSYLLLARKLNSAGIKNVGVVMSGIIGNRLLYDGAGLLATVYGQSLLKRAERDAFTVAGVKYIIVKIGDNDVLHPMETSMQGIAPYSSPSEIIEGYRELSRQAAALGTGIRLYLCTRTPYKGYERNFFGSKDLTWTQQGENMLLEINSWVKYASDDYYNGCINLDALRDPNDSTKLRDHMTTDGIHFSELGQIAFVDLIPEAAYGVTSEIPDIATVLGVDPYVAPVTQTAPATNNNVSNNGNADAEQTTPAPTTAANAPSTTIPSIVAPSTEIRTAPFTQPPTIANANQILLGGNEPDNMTPAGTVSDDSSAEMRQLIGFIILAAVAVMIITIAAVLLIRMNPGKKGPLLSFSRETYGRTKHKSRA